MFQMKKYFVSTIVIAAIAVSAVFVSCNKDKDNDEPVAVTEIRVSPDEKHLKHGESFTIQAIVFPENATNKGVFWRIFKRDGNTDTGEYMDESDCISINASGLTCTVTALSTATLGTRLEVHVFHIEDMDMKEPYYCVVTIIE